MSLKSCLGTVDLNTVRSRSLNVVIQSLIDVKHAASAYPIMYLYARSLPVGGRGLSNCVLLCKSSPHKTRKLNQTPISADVAQSPKTEERARTVITAFFLMTQNDRGNRLTAYSTLGSLWNGLFNSWR